MMAAAPGTPRMPQPPTWLGKRCSDQALSIFDSRILRTGQPNGPKPTATPSSLALTVADPLSSPTRNTTANAANGTAVAPPGSAPTKLSAADTSSATADSIVIVSSHGLPTRLTHTERWPGRSFSAGGRSPSGTGWSGSPRPRNPAPTPAAVAPASTATTAHPGSTASVHDTLSRLA